jgi:hypothetical protein
METQQLSEVVQLLKDQISQLDTQLIDTYQQTVMLFRLIEHLKTA